MRRALLAVAECQLHDMHGWADETCVLARAYGHYKHQRQARWRLAELVRRGLLTRRLTRPRGHIQLLTLTAEGLAYIAPFELRTRGFQPTRPPRLDHAIHHLLVVEASLQILADQNAKLVQLYGDDSLRSDSRRGRRLKEGEPDAPLPDGRLVYRTEDGRDHTTVDIEILTSAYTDKEIRKKFDQLRDAGTLFYATTRRLCERTEALVGVRPILLHRDTPIET